MMERLVQLFSIAGGGILGPLFAGAFLLAVSQSLHNKFVNPQSNWGEYWSKRKYFCVAWITGATFFVIFFFMINNI